VPDNSVPLPDFTRWPSFPFEGPMRVKPLAEPVDVEPPRNGEDGTDCVACVTPDEAYVWVSERWRVRAMDRPTGLPVVLILECRSHLDLGDLPNLLAAELGVMTVRLERAIRSLDGVARVHVNRWGDGSAHLHLWFLARPYGRLQLRGTFLSLWDDILPVIPEQQWRENLALVAAWLAEFGGEAIAEPPHIQWQAPSTISFSPDAPPTKPASHGSTSEKPADNGVTGETGLTGAVGGTATIGETAEKGSDAASANSVKSGVDAAGEISAEDRPVAGRNTAAAFPTAGDAGRAGSGDAGRTAGGDAGRTASGDAGRTAGEDAGRTAGEDAGRTAAEGSERTAAEDGSGKAAEDGERTAAEDGGGKAAEAGIGANFTNGEAAPDTDGADGSIIPPQRTGRQPGGGSSSGSSSGPLRSAAPRPHQP
jgi:hypothetical protein